jgi:hypothetical protein
MLRPERAVVRDPVDEWFHSAGVDPVVDTASLTPAFHQARTLQRRQVLRYRRLRNVESRGEIFYGRLSAGKRLENRAPARIGQHLKDSVFGNGYALHGLIYKP